MTHFAVHGRGDALAATGMAFDFALEFTAVRDTCFGAASGCVQSTVRASVANYAGPGVSGNNISNYSAISADGHYIVFVSAATNFLPTPSNGHAMVWLAKSGF